MTPSRVFSVRRALVRGFPVTASTETRRGRGPYRNRARLGVPVDLYSLVPILAIILVLGPVSALGFSYTPLGRAIVKRLGGPTKRWCRR